MSNSSAVQRAIGKCPISERTLSAENALYLGFCLPKEANKRTHSTGFITKKAFKTSRFYPFFINNFAFH